MPEETRYITISGNVPNGGVPPGRMFASVAYPPPALHPGYRVASGPFSPPPAYTAPQCNGSYLPYYPTRHPGSPPPGSPTPAPPATAAPAAPASTTAPYEPPGQYLDGDMLRGKGWSYITPGEHTWIHFVGDGTRPCDLPDGYYPNLKFSKHRVPTMMTVKDLIKGLGAPAGKENGITEVEELGFDRYAEGETITQGSKRAKKTLAEMGWTQRRSELAPIILVVKR